MRILQIINFRLIQVRLTQPFHPDSDLHLQIYGGVITQLTSPTTVRS